MKTISNILFLLGGIIIMVMNSCESELLDDTIDNNQDMSIMTKSSVSDAPIDLLNDLYNIPVNIYLPPGANAVGKRFLSASKSDVGINLVNEDSGSGRERWFLHNLSSNNQNQFSIKAQGGAYSPYLTIMENMSSTQPWDDGFIYMSNDERPVYANVSTSWKILPVDNKFLIRNNYDRIVWWLNGMRYGSNWPGGNDNIEPPVNDILCRWVIEPVSKFELIDVEYKQFIV